MRRFPSLRYVMTSNVPFEKNKMASTLAASVSLHGLFTKCKEAERRVKFKGNRKRCREETEKKCNHFFLGKLPAGKLFCKFHITTKRREIESRIVDEWSDNCLYPDKNFCPKLKSKYVSSYGVLIPPTTGFGWLVVLGVTAL